MKLSTLLTNVAFASALSMTTLPSFAADAAAEGAINATPQTPAPGEVTPPTGNMESMPAAPGVPNAMGAEVSGSSSMDFGVVDGNKDGSISMGEYLKYGGTSESFRQSDKNNDNKLDSSELMTQ